MPAMPTTAGVRSDSGEPEDVAVEGGHGLDVGGVEVHLGLAEHAGHPRDGGRPSPSEAAALTVRLTPPTGSLHEEREPWPTSHRTTPTQRRSRASRSRPSGPSTRRS